MAKVKRANVILHIKDSLLQKYLDNGYEQIDETTGEVLASPVPSDIATLRRYYVEHTERIAELEAELAKLKKPAKKSKSDAE